MRAMRFAIAALMLVAVCQNATAGYITFTIAGDANDWPWIGRSFQPGTITGILDGLNDNASGQAPTSIQFTSDVSALGITSTLVTPSIVDGHIDISGGVVQSTSTLLFNFNDPVIGGMQFRLNYQSANVLHWNGSLGPISGMGNVDGFGGATYSTLNEQTVTPEPTSLALAGFAGIGMAVGAWRRRRQQPA